MDFLLLEKENIKTKEIISGMRVPKHGEAHQRFQNDCALVT